VAAGAAPEGEADAASANGAHEDLVAPDSTVTETETVETVTSGSAGEATEAPRRRRAPRIHVPGDPDGPAASAEVIQEAATEFAADPVELLEADLELKSDGSPEGSDAADGPPVVKRKTRRGSRGGRNHRKKPAVAGADGDLEAAAAVVTVVAGIPDAEAGATDGLPMVVAAEPTAEAASWDEPVTDEPGEADESSDAGYVPMSEWLDDFDRR
jgi:hypothetical protein